MKNYFLMMLVLILALVNISYALGEGYPAPRHNTETSDLIPLKNGVQVLIRKGRSDSAWNEGYDNKKSTKCLCGEQPIKTIVPSDVYDADPKIYYPDDPTATYVLLRDGTCVCKCQYDDDNPYGTTRDPRAGHTGGVRLDDTTLPNATTGNCAIM